MARRKIGNEKVRNIQKTRDTYSISIPMRIMQKLGWRKRQKVVVDEKRGRITISDWKKGSP